MSELKVDTLTGKTSAGDITVTSESGAATMQLQQGLAKAWANTNQTSTQSNRDSFNITSITDGGLGVTTLGFVNSMDNANYSSTGQEGSTNTTGYALQIPYSTAANTTGQYAWVAFNGARSAAADASVISTAIHGDLA